MHGTDHDVARANIDNLIALWRALGGRAENGQGRGIARLHPAWPRRCWFDTGDAAAHPEQVAAVLTRLPAGYIVPLWDSPIAQVLRPALAAEGFAAVFRQTAMTLDLAEYTAAGDAAGSLRDGRRLTLQRVGDADVRNWCSVGAAAFDYPIEPGVISRALGAPGLELYLARLDNTAVATGLLWRTGEVVGIHQVGVPRKFRGLGIARTLMRQLLDRSVDCGAARVVLQASDEGEPLYRSLGFAAQFVIENYARGEPVSRSD